MNENLNLLEILKDCPKGTKLYSTWLGSVEFVDIHKVFKRIIVTRGDGHFWGFSPDGRYAGEMPGDKLDNEITLFPSKDQRDWKQFNTNMIPLDGELYRVVCDLDASVGYYIYRRGLDNLTSCYCSVFYTVDRKPILSVTPGIVYFKSTPCLSIAMASDNERKDFHQALAKEGYWWNGAKRIVEKLKFRVGDIITNSTKGLRFQIDLIQNRHYCTKQDSKLSFKTYDICSFDEQDQWEKVEGTAVNHSSTCSQGGSISNTVVEPAHTLYFYQVTEDTHDNKLMRDMLVRLSNAETPAVDKENIYAPGDLIYNDRRTLRICKYGSKMYRTVYLVGMKISIPKTK